MYCLTSLKWYVKRKWFLNWLQDTQFSLSVFLLSLFFFTWQSAIYCLLSSHIQHRKAVDISVNNIHSHSAVLTSRSVYYQEHYGFLKKQPKRTQTEHNVFRKAFKCLEHSLKANSSLMLTGNMELHVLV